MSFDFSHLNSEQKRAVEETDGPALILAGAGSGKTRTLTARIAYLISKKKVKAENILALTFTNKAAREMRNRIESSISTQINNLWIGTFHSIAARILRIEGEALGFSKNFTIYDTDDSVRAIKKVISTLSVPQQLYSAKMIQSRLSRIKNQFLFPDDLYDQEREGLDEYLPSIYISYQRFLKENNAFDFDDLLIKPIELFNNNPKILKKYQNKFKYILVDEYQDTNRVQYLFIRKLVEGHENLCVVGDEDQSIYGWRGADINNILNFQNDFDKTKTFKLEENYRSNKHILEAANVLVSHNKERIGKNLWTQKQEGNKIEVQIAQNDSDEAKKIVEKIHEEVFTNKRSFKDIAILYRTNVQSRVLEDHMRKNAISYDVVGGVKFYDRKEIKDLTAYLKLIVNPADSISLKRIINFPLRGIGETTVSKIEKFAEMEQIILFDALGRVEEIASISPVMSNRVITFYNMIKNYINTSNEVSAVELVSSLANESGMMHHYQTEYDQYESESRVANIREFFNSIEDFTETRKEQKRDNTLAAFLEEISLLSDIDNWNSEKNAVTLMTLHSAKGLEFPVVFITGLEMGLLPLQRNSADIAELEEERRLLYVGMTRAEEKLYLSYAKTRRKNNNMIQTLPSLFIDEIPQNLLKYSAYEAAPVTVTTRRRRRKSKLNAYIDRSNGDENQDSEFKVGQKVYHATFGKGEIKRLEGFGEKMKITVFFSDEGITKKLIKAYANLTALEE